MLYLPTLSALEGPSYYPVHDLLTELLSHGARAVRLPGGSGESPLAKGAERLRINRNIGRRRAPMLIPMMGLKPYSIFPYTYLFDVIPFCWDVWEPDYDRWTRFLARHRPRLVFVTSQQSAAYLDARLPELTVVWMPEATIDPGLPVKPLTSRTIDVLEIGRRHEAYHDQIVSALAVDGRRHMFEATRGEIIFPTRKQLLQGLGDAAVSICFPSSHTHPERSGSISTLTQRYLETMLMGALPVGSAPAELVELFGYNPVVEVNVKFAQQQLRDILRDLPRWQALCDRNRARARSVGVWEVRATQLLGELTSHGVDGMGNR